MQLTRPQPPQDHEFEALHSGLNGFNGFNEAVTGPLHRERIASFIKDAEGVVRGGILGGDKMGLAPYRGALGR